MKGSVLQVSKPFEGMKNRFENLLYGLYPQHFDEGRFAAIHIGSNNDAAPLGFGGFKLNGAVLQKEALYLQLPDKMFADKVLADPDLRKASVITKVADSVVAYANERVAQLVADGKSLEEAQAKVADSIPKIAYYDRKLAQYVAEPVVRGVSDAMLSGMTTPYWNVTQIPKIYKQPYLKGYADRLVSKMGAPNVWADLIQIFKASYEGAARLSNVAHTGLEFNTSIAGKRKTSTMLSEMVNLVIDYESPGPDEQMIANQGAWLVNATLGDMDVFADLMLEILMNTLIYFGNDESGFDGLSQIATRDDCYTQYPDDRPPAQYLWEHDGVGGGVGPVNTTVGADLLLMLNHLIADKMEELHFLPTKMIINCGSAMYKVLNWSQLSKVFNQNGPLSIIDTANQAQNRVVGTMVTQSAQGLQFSFEICPDPMLDPNTPFNPTDEDLMFITFPSFQSALEVDNVLDDLVMMPQLIDKMVLPSAPGYRDGVVRTSLKRIGSLLCPIRKTVHCITGMGTNSRYIPDGTVTPVEVHVTNTVSDPVNTKEAE
jgi:hypothetical protein